MTAQQRITPLIDARGLHTYYGESHVLHGAEYFPVSVCVSI